jgi:hypothetical protein
VVSAVSPRTASASNRLHASPGRPGRRGGFERLWLGCALLACCAALPACAPAASELGDPPPGSTLVVYRTTSSSAGTIFVNIDGVRVASLTSTTALAFLSCTPATTGEEVTSNHVYKFVTEGAHTVTWSGGASGSTSVSTIKGFCTYKSV